MYEHRRQKLVSRRVFLARVARHFAAGTGLVLAALAGGMAGYHYFEGLPWLDAYLNAAMILGGMGPVAELHSRGGKLFAGSYALFAGLVFITVSGVVMAPVLHRAMHRFHVGEEDGKKADG